MRIQQNSITFQAGLNSRIAFVEQYSFGYNAERFFRNSPIRDFGSFYKIDLKDNKLAAACNMFCADIFRDLRKMFDFRINPRFGNLVFPHDLYVYNRSEGRTFKNNEFFTAHKTMTPCWNRPAFETGAVFIPNEINTLGDLNSSVEERFAKNMTSSNHFLYDYVHEWLNAALYKIIEVKKGRDSAAFADDVKKYKAKTLTKDECELLNDTINTYPIRYANGQYTAVIADAWAKFICDSLTADCTGFRNHPLDVLNSMPDEFKNLLNKVTDLSVLRLFNGQQLK